MSDAWSRRLVADRDRWKLAYENAHAELAEMRQERDGWKREAEKHINATNRATDRADGLRRELADWQRHGVKVTVDCDNPTCDGGIYATAEGREPLLCPDCGGTGKKSRDGAWRWNLSGEHGDEPTVLFPAEWLEATDE